MRELLRRLVEHPGPFSAAVGLLSAVVSLATSDSAASPVALAITVAAGAFVGVGMYVALRILPHSG